jgi:hypothetical protein
MSVDDLLRAVDDLSESDLEHLGDVRLCLGIIDQPVKLKQVPS